MQNTKSLASSYAAALARAWRAAPRDASILVENLLAHLRAKGRLALLPAIARALKREEKRESCQSPLLEVAREGEKKEALHSALRSGFAAPPIVVNNSLIRGWRLRGGGTLIDHSAKRALIEIYQNSTR